MNISNMWASMCYDPEMCDWAYRYLKLDSTSSQSGAYVDKYRACINFLNTYESEGARKLKELEMQNAWRQKKSKQREREKGKSARSYSLSNDSIRQLEDLAYDSKLTLSQTLETIINQAYAKKLANLKRKDSNSLRPKNENQQPTEIK